MIWGRKRSTLLLLMLSVLQFLIFSQCLVWDSRVSIHFFLKNMTKAYQTGAFVPFKLPHILQQRPYKILLSINSLTYSVTADEFLCMKSAPTDHWFVFAQAYTSVEKQVHDTIVKIVI